MSNLIRLQERFDVYFNEHKLRRGQSYMNALYEIDKDLYNEITGTDCDCFYDDKKISTFIKRVFG
jgi:hypothetical protein